MTRLWKALLSLTRQQVRSLYAIAMLAGIVALSAESWVLLGLASGAEGQWFQLLLERLRIVSGLTGLFALIVALTVFGADYFKAKFRDVEFESGAKQAAREVADAADDKAAQIEGEV